MTQTMLEKIICAMAQEIQRQAYSDDGTLSFPVASDLKDGCLIGFDGMLDLQKMAIVALEAMREPSLAVILAGADIPDSVQRLWPKLIDAAINERKI